MTPTPTANGKIKNIGQLIFGQLHRLRSPLVRALACEWVVPLCRYRRLVPLIHNLVEVEMHLESIKYSECVGTPQEWTLDAFSIGKKNLVVGKNASGKSRTLNVISSIGLQLAGMRAPSMSSNYECHFVHGADIYTYHLSMQDAQIASENLWVNEKQLIERGDRGEGSIFAEQIENGIQIRFQAPTSDLAAVVRRDSIQHPFLEPLYEWAASLRHYRFGTSLGKDNFAIIVPQGGAIVDERDGNAVVALFRKAQKEFDKQFTDAVVDDLIQLDYHVTEVGVGPPVSLRVSGAPGELIGLYVREKDLPGITDQHSMSQGMFRVLALLVHLNYFQLKKSATCVLIDDVGEGLDFDRSCRLIELLRTKADQSDIQLVLSTNDRFVMNQVPLEEWSVLQRIGCHVAVKNYSNSKKLFEEFRFTGLSNFSFLEMNIAGQSPEMEKAG